MLWAYYYLVGVFWLADKSVSPSSCCLLGLLRRRGGVCGVGCWEPRVCSSGCMYFGGFCCLGSCSVLVSVSGSFLFISCLRFFFVGHMIELSFVIWFTWFWSFV